MSNLSIDEIRNIIAKRSLDHIHKCNESGNIDYLIIKTFPGSGKTATTMKTIDEAKMNWIYVCPFHDIITDNLKFSKLRSYRFTHLKGKKQDGVCMMPEYAEYAKKGFNITPFCETRCHWKHNGCIYYETRKEIESLPQSWAGVHSHIPTYLQSYLYDIEYEGRLMYNYYDVIIIDEFPFQVLYNQSIAQKKNIDNLRDVISYMNDSPEKVFVMNILNQLMLSSEHIDINYKAIKTFLSQRNLDFDTFIEAYDSNLLYLVGNDIINKPPIRMLYQLKEIYDKNPSIDRLKWNIHYHSYDGWNRPGIYITTSNIEKFQNLPLPIIALDATAKNSAWDALLNDRCKIEHIDLEYQNIYQLHTKARYPVSTWITRQNRTQFLSESGIRLAQLVQRICERKKYDVLLCANKRLQKLLTKYLRKNYGRTNYQFANYYNLRSRNSFYERCDTCIITHEPNIPPLQMNIVSSITGWDISLLQDLMTRSEILQAIGRIRQNIKTTPNGRTRKKIEVYIFPGGSDEKIIPEAKLLSFNRMADGILISMEKEITQIIRNAECTSKSALWKVCKSFTTKRKMRNILRKLYLNEFITDYKNTIKWDKNAEKERKRTKYKRKQKI